MTELLNGIVDHIVDFITLLSDIFDFIYCLFTFIPQPFRNILIAYIGTILVYLIVKGVRGS